MVAVGTAEDKAMARRDNRATIIKAALDLAAKQPWREITWRYIAGAASLSLGDVAREFSSKPAILGAFMADIDVQLLDALEPDTLADPPIDRLFDIIMKRLELLAPHKQAIAGIVRDCGDNPFEQLCLAGAALRSQRWMLAGAGISTEGLLGAVKIRGLALVYGRVLRCWIKDDDPGLARTMAVLDRQLRRGDRWLRRGAGPAGLLRGACSFVDAVRTVRRRARSRRRGPDEAAATS